MSSSAPSDPDFQFLSEQQARRRGARNAVGAPAAVLFAGMIGFGALSQSVGMSIWASLGTSGLIFALPGQIVMAEMMAVGASGLIISLVVALTAARFLPMTLTVMPQIPNPHRDLRLFLWVHLLAMTSWAVAMRDFPRIAPEYRKAYFQGFGLVCWGVCLPGTALGYLLAGQLPGPMTVALVFLNPLFFVLNFTEVKPLAFRLAILVGGILGPLSYLLSPSYSLLLTGLVGGSLVYLIDRFRRMLR